MNRTVVVILMLLGASRNAVADDAIAFGKGGILLGARTIYKAPVQGAAFDAAQELLWFESKGKLQVIDLRDPKQKYRPVVVLNRFPVIGSFTISGASSAQYFDGDPSVTADLWVGKKPVLHTQAPGYGYLDPDAAEKLRKKVLKAKITGKKWLAALEKRSKRTDLPPEPVDNGEMVSPPGGCDFGEKQTGACAMAQPFGYTAFNLVNVIESCGDMCHDECQLYDPKTKLWMTPNQPSGTWGKTTTDTGACSPYYFDKDGKTYYFDHLRCTLDAGLTCQEDKAWTYVGVASPASSP